MPRPAIVSTLADTLEGAEDSYTAANQRLSFGSFGGPAEQEVGLHGPLAFDINAAVRLQAKPFLDMPMGCSRYLDTVRQAMGLHSAGDVHRVTPDVVGELVCPNDPR